MLDVRPSDAAGRRSPVGSALRAAASAALVTVSTVGGIAATGWWGALFAGGLVVSSPQMTDAVVRRRFQRRVPPEQLSDSELCRAWHDSASDLSRPSTSERRLDVVQWRAALLEELALRHPDTFDRWTSDGPSPGDPHRFFTDPELP